jgi:hypothetical protein
MNDQPAPSMKPTGTPRLYAEEEHGSTVVLQMRSHRNYPQRFFTMFETSSMLLAGMDRPTCYFRCLHFLLATLDPVQFRRISASEIAKEAHMSQSSAERGLALLEADRAIFCKGSTGAKARRLNNNLISKQNSEKWNSAQRDPEVIDSRGR